MMENWIKLRKIARRSLNKLNDWKLVRKRKIRHKFSEVYEENLFAGLHSRSGEGSGLTQTEVIRNELPQLIKKLKIKTLIDAPCGDWYWMREINLGVEKYIGIDIVRSMIKKNKKEFGNASTLFLKKDLIYDALPKADLIFSRDCLVHLRLDEGLKAIANFKRSGSTFLLATTFTERTKNSDLVGENGEDYFWRPLNLQVEPFNFPKPHLIINENCSEENGAYADKSLGLWLLSDISL